MFLRVIDAEYTVEEDGYKHATPIVHLFGRDTEWRRHHVRVRGFAPYFCVRQSAYREMADQLCDDTRVAAIETTDTQGRPERAIDGEALIRICVREPSDVAALRELFDDPFEADVQFPVRFLIDMASSQWIQVPDDGGDSGDPISADRVSPVDEPPDVTPPLRVCTYDIEVVQGGDGPPVVSTEGTERAANPVSAIAAHDSFTDEYRLWLTEHPMWDDSAHQRLRESCDVSFSIYSNPHDTVSQFCEWVTDRRMDALTGWNASGFDHPYLVNYGLSNGVSAVYELSPIDEVYPMDGDGSFINQSLKGRLLLDSLTLYKKTQIHSLDSYRLADVAETEGVSVGKLDLESQLSDAGDDSPIDYAWKHEPTTFAEYSVRDVKACVAINRESQRNVDII